jgi:hypothetical protein
MKPALYISILSLGLAACATGPGFPVAPPTPDVTTKPGFIGTWEKTGTPACAGFPQKVVISLANRRHAKIAFVAAADDSFKDAWTKRGEDDAEVANYWADDDTLDFSQDHFWLANPSSMVYSHPGPDGMDSCSFLKSGPGVIRPAS